MRRHCSDETGSHRTGPHGNGFKRNAYVVLLCLTMAREANADDEGCTVLLCLSNPAGWSVVAECVPPVRRALKAMARGRVPQCTFSGGAGGTDARIVWVTEVLPGGTDTSEAVHTVRALEFRDASGNVRRIKF